MTRYNDGFDDNPFLDDIVGRVIRETNLADSTHDQVFDQWVRDEQDRAKENGFDFGTFTDRERTAILTRFVARTTPPA